MSTNATPPQQPPQEGGVPPEQFIWDRPADVSDWPTAVKDDDGSWGYEDQEDDEWEEDEDGPESGGDTSPGDEPAPVGPGPLPSEQEDGPDPGVLVRYATVDRDGNPVGATGVEASALARIWDESKIRRGVGGRFADKPDAPKPARAPRMSTSRKMRPATDADRARLKIPPAWSDVMVNEHPSAALQAVGLDAKGRKQYRYSTEHSSRQAAAKFARLRKFDSALPRIMDRAWKDDSDEAVVIRLIHATGFRPGSTRETQADKQAFGATTLLGKHAEVKGDTVTFKFTGKKGVEIERSVSDPDLAKQIAERKKKAGDDGDLFQTDDSKIRSWLSKNGGKGFMVKDFRTWRANVVALEALDAMDPPADEKALKKSRTVVAKHVATVLGNTPAVSLASYIHPAVFAPWEAAIEGIA